MSDPHAKKIPGSTFCDCGASYKNNAVPPYCIGCGFHLGKQPELNMLVL